MCVAGRPEHTFVMQLYVGNLAPETDEGVLYELIRLLAPAECVRLPKKKGAANHQGYGFVDFANASDAEYVLKINQEQPIVLNGRSIKVRAAAQSSSNTHNTNDKSYHAPSSNGTTQGVSSSRGAPQKSGFGLFVHNVDPSMLSEEDVRIPFSRFGNICDIVIPLDAAGQPRGHALVRFVERAAAERAKQELEGQTLLNGKCKIEYERV